jgi:hypothetical protein
MVARIEPMMAALITKNMSLERRTMKRIISTIDPILEVNESVTVSRVHIHEEHT